MYNFEMNVDKYMRLQFDGKNNSDDLEHGSCKLGLTIHIALSKFRLKAKIQDKHISSAFSGF